MPRVIGIDPGTVSLDVCGLVDGRVDLDLTFPTAEALADPERFIQTLAASGRPDLVAGPSGYGLPLTPAAAVSEADLRLAFLAGPDETGGIGGLRRFARQLGGEVEGEARGPERPVDRDRAQRHERDGGGADRAFAGVHALPEREEDIGPVHPHDPAGMAGIIPQPRLEDLE